MMSEKPSEPYDWQEYALSLESVLIEQDKRIAELERDYKKVNAALVAVCDSLPIRDLEQQAKGLEDFKIPEMSYQAFHRVGDALNEQAAELRSQAKQLKGEG